MPDQLSPAARRRGWADPASLRRFAVLLLLWAAAGAVLGVVWELLWDPPVGTVYRGEWYPTREGLAADASATSLFALLGLAGGLVLGLVTALRGQGAELVTLVAACLGSVLAAWLMFHVGHALGPPDPRVAAAGAAHLSELPGDLRLGGAGTRPWPFWFESSAFCALPAGALLAMVGVFLSAPRRRSER